MYRNPVPSADPVVVIPVRYAEGERPRRRRGFGTAVVMGVLLGMLSAEGLLLHQVAERSRLVLIEPWDEGDEVVATMLATGAPPRSQGAVEALAQVETIALAPAARQR